MIKHDEREMKKETNRSGNVGSYVEPKVHLAIDVTDLVEISEPDRGGEESDTERPYMSDAKDTKEARRTKKSVSCSAFSEEGVSGDYRNRQEQSTAGHDRRPYEGCFTTHGQTNVPQQ